MVNVRIEVSKNSRLKYEYDKEKQYLVLDRILHNSNCFPYNYGYILNTLSMDGDALDAILICDEILIPGCILDCRIIGGIYTDDENGRDDKIFVVPYNKIDKNSKNFNDIDDISKTILNNYIYFLNHYKDGEDKFINVGNVYNKEKALEIYEKSKL